MRLIRSHLGEALLQQDGITLRVDLVDFVHTSAFAIGPLRLRLRHRDCRLARQVITLFADLPTPLQTLDTPYVNEPP